MLDFQDAERYKVDNPRTYHYLNQSNCYELDGVDDSKEYLDTKRAMDVVGISSDEQVVICRCYSFSCILLWHPISKTFLLQDAIFRVVAAVLHLGNIEFTKGSDTDSSEPKDDQSRFHLKTAAELFM